MEKCGVTSSFLLFLLICALSRAANPPVKEPCALADNDLTVSCRPCEKDKWLEMVDRPQGDEASTNPEKTCFNDDPITIDEVDKTDHGDDSTLMGTDAYRPKTSLGPKGFLVRKEPFFRYAYLTPAQPLVPPPPTQPPGPTPTQPPGPTPTQPPGPTPTQPPGPTPTQPPGPPQRGVPAVPIPDNPLEPYFDVNIVKKYYVKRDGKGIVTEEADIQLMEWPGLTAKKIFETINDKENETSKSWMLHVERNSGKILHYPCNFEDGTNIVAVTAVRSVNTTAPDGSEMIHPTKQQLWLASGVNSIFHSYIQPLHVPLPVLAQMVQDESESKPNVSCIVNDDKPSMDLRTVLDFTFTRDRLILGMKCGIIVIEGLHSGNLTFKAAERLTYNGTFTYFPEPVNQISSHTCCLSAVLCGETASMVGAYSFNPERNATENKFIYVSYDFGERFETRIIATSLSPINLIKGLYQFYETWADYFEILEGAEKYDLDQDDSKLRSLRSKAEWKQGNFTKKEEMFAIGTPARKKLASLNKTVEILEDRVPVRRKRFPRKKDLSPQWVNEIMNRTRVKHGWRPEWDSKCDEVADCKARFENDVAVDFLLNGSGIHVKTPRRDENELYCREIVSFLFIPEEEQFLCLCMIGFHKLNATQPPFPVEQGQYALFNFPIKASLPLIYGSRVSHRILVCTHLKIKRDNGTEQVVYPSILRVQNSGTIVISNCKGTIYLSTNLGSTLFNAAFYYEHEIIHEYCSNDTSYVPPDAAKNSSICPHEPYRTASNKTTYIRTFDLCALDMPPLITIDTSGFFLVMTFGRFYAKGAITFNRETRLVVGEVLRPFELPNDTKYDNLAFPSLDVNGDAIVAVSLTQLYSIDQSPANKFRTPLYEQRLALRLVPIPIPYHKDSRHYHEGNLGMCNVAKDKRFGFPVCTTSEYSVYPRYLDMDVGDKEYIQVTVTDEDPFLPLWIFSSNENSLDVAVYLSRREGSPLPHINFHNWKLEVRAKAGRKNDEIQESLVDAFFGSDYNNLNEISTQISFVNRPNVRCHVRPSSTVNVQIGCKGKKLVAFEETYRPQCQDFQNGSFYYTLQQNQFDHEMVNEWKSMSSKQSANMFNISESNGTLRVLYDYVNWGCPIEPFRNEEFLPDLWIVEEVPENNTIVTRPFRGEFILIDIFGNAQFTYKTKVKDVGCLRRPQFLKEVIREWKLKHRLFELASNRLVYPKTRKELEKLTHFSQIYGNALLKNREIHRHINIWNQANYRSCHRGQAEDFDDVKDKEYNIFTSHAHGKNPNKIKWKKNPLRVSVFLAVAVDFNGSLCEYQTLFAVSMRKNYDLDSWISILMFLLFCAFWAVLIVGGYHVRMRYLVVEYTNTAKTERLEQAAWSIIYRYEKLIHGEAMAALFNSNPTGQQQSGVASTVMTAKSLHEKKRAELAMKRNHVMAQEQARHERLQKLFIKQ